MRIQMREGVEISNEIFKMRSHVGDLSYEHLAYAVRMLALLAVAPPDRRVSAAIE